jgi:hypothetical protein
MDRKFSGSSIIRRLLTHPHCRRARLQASRHIGDMHPHRVFAPDRDVWKPSPSIDPRACPRLHSIALSPELALVGTHSDSSGMPRSARSRRSAATGRCACAGSRDRRVRCPQPDAGRRDERRNRRWGVAGYTVEIGAEVVPDLVDWSVPIKAVVLRHGHGTTVAEIDFHRRELDNGGAADFKDVVPMVAKAISCLKKIMPPCTAAHG